jgi:nuclear pore complex protein Nup214
VNLIPFSDIFFVIILVLHIINAPKAGPTQYIAYSDVCYSASETRPSKVYLNHIIPWNMLIIASANSLDVSFLRVTQVGDIPVWTQEFPNDMFPAELPLTASKEESFPVGFDLDLGCSTKVVGDDSNLYPVMPMLHIMSTEGVLCSFYLMNTLPTYVDICSPARPIDSASLSLFQVQEQKKTEVSKTPPNSEISFASPISQSTPAIAKVQPKPTFGITQPATTAPPIFDIWEYPTANNNFWFNTTTFIELWKSACKTI